MRAIERQLPQVGAPDPERNTSAIIDESEYDENAASPDLEREASACYFNDEAFAHRDYVQSGGEVLQCDRGVWVRRGEKQPGG
jgi:hypothetical protein